MTDLGGPLPFIKPPGACILRQTTVANVLVFHFFSHQWCLAGNTRFPIVLVVVPALVLVYQGDSRTGTRNGTHNPKQAFPRIELPVVIGIITVLSALLLPVLSKAKKKGYQVRCVNNLRQLQRAWFAYATDHNGWLPRLGQGQSAGRTRCEYPWVTGWLDGLTKKPVTREKCYGKFQHDNPAIAWLWERTTQVIR